MNAERAVEALVERVDGGETVDCDGLSVEGDPEGYRLELPELERTGLSTEELRRTLSAFGEYATNWRYWDRVGGAGTARRAFLRWCERAPVPGEATPGESDPEPLAVPDRYDALAEGIDREWGQLLLTTTLAENGDRRYDLRHVEDAGAAVEDLDTYDEPREARELTTFDEDGRYRPLKTAPTLVPGWVFPSLSATELVSAVGFFYPATVENWHREREGELDVDHWIDTAERQTGIYDVIDELPREAVDWMAEACCVDSQCLRRREWEYDSEDPVDAPGGEGPFPCREPCSLVIAAARSWAIDESEESHTWEVELTRGERNQIEEIVDAVAEGRTEEIREADVGEGANRYRARYLRAKRFGGEDDGDEGGEGFGDLVE
ncbi:DR2241 family protein [Saliphagus sp. LR7]|uniref:DR2241 family protein n=1 Tax=Saliphagus sp. LR7 TaxID=2282654 RepID=UPI000DF7BD8B|nr:DR2241 family protein [Saliphagus sp. LR7]